MQTSIRSRGFTLIELLVGTVVGSIVLLGISMTFISQAQQYQSHASRRAIQASARQGMAFMERKVRAAGYGVHSDRAVLAYDSYDVVSDSAVAGYPDAVVVHSRDPLFRRRVQASAAAQIVLTAPISEPMRRGQILLVLCKTEHLLYAFATVNQYLPAGTFNIPLDPTAPGAAPNSPTGAPGGLFREQATLDDACFDDPSTTVVMVNRAAFYVAMFDDDGDPATSGSTPFLMMHQGLDMPSSLSIQGDGVIDANDSVPVAQGIEQFQVAYILNANNDLAPADPPIIVGVQDAPMMAANYYGEAWQASNIATAGFTSTETPPVKWFFDDSVGLGHSLRRENHPANIRQVRLTVVARSTVPDPQITGDDMMTGAQGVALPNGVIPWRQLENLDTPVADFNPTGRGYYRVILREAVTPKNLQMNDQFLPVAFIDNPAVPGGG